MTDLLRVKRLLAALWSLRGAQSSSRRIVLLYHSVGSGPWAMPESQFRQQIEWLKSDTEVASLPDLLRSTSTARLQAAVTFDDGYESLYQKAFPILNAFGIPATGFLNTGWMGDDEPKASDPSLGHYPGEAFLLWRDVRKLAEAGWTFGSHGVDHLDLTTVTDDVAHFQLEESKRRIEEELSAACEHFAYTWGRHSSHLHRLVAAAGYRYAMSAEHGPVHGDTDPVAVPRVNISRDYTIDDFKAIVRGDWDYLGWIQRCRNNR